ncbi:MAG TPA: efflux transporter outer membrane subunit [Rhizomicrobium sp.]|nr:efflux transporter outer membrane subunit [Rhizomicrobium sp.]
MRRALFLTAVPLLLWGCTNGPLPTLSKNDVPAKFAETSPQNAPLWPQSDWWQGFGDPQLTALIAEAQANNLDIAQAAARLRQADGRVRQAGAALLPNLNFNPNVEALYGQANGTSSHETDWVAALGASYELDFWGKYRDAVDAARAQQTASDADRATVALTVTAAVADAYFQLLSLRERIAVAESNLKTSQDTLNLVQRRVDAGYAATSDLTQERANMDAIEAALPPLEQQALETQDALAILLGRPPEGFSVTGVGLDKVSQPSVAPGLPSELLTRRPDIQSAEANLVAAHANLAAARTAFLPDISLTATFGVAYPALNAAVNNIPAVGLSQGLGASLMQVIFDGGKIEGQVAEAKAREEELLSAYRAAVISSFSDVENALGNLTHLNAQQAALKNQVDHSEQVLQSARRKYTSGYADFLTVTDAEKNLNAARDQLSDIRRAQLAASVALFKAMGGGYRGEAPTEIAQGR